MSEYWDPIVFYICANIHKCVISIQADATHEYQIFPDETPKLPPIRFGRLERFRFVYLGSGRKLVFFKLKIYIQYFRFVLNIFFSTIITNDSEVYYKAIIQ